MVLSPLCVWCQQRVSGRQNAGHWLLSGRTRWCPFLSGPEATDGPRRWPGCALWRLEQRARLGSRKWMGLRFRSGHCRWLLLDSGGRASLWPGESRPGASAVAPPGDRPGGGFQPRFQEEGEAPAGLPAQHPFLRPWPSGGAVTAGGCSLLPPEPGQQRLGSRAWAAEAGGRGGDPQARTHLEDLALCPLPAPSPFSLLWVWRVLASHVVHAAVMRSFPSPRRGLCRPGVQRARGLGLRGGAEGGGGGEGVAAPPWPCPCRGWPGRGPELHPGLHWGQERHAGLRDAHGLQR